MANGTAPAGLQGAFATLTSALQQKYGWEYRIITTLEKVVGTVRRRHPERVVLRIGTAA